MNDRIRPGREWLDTEGKRIEAHGGTMFYEDGVYYWLGEDKSHTGKKGRIWTWGIKLYASRELPTERTRGISSNRYSTTREASFIRPAVSTVRIC